ncbi:hypothetical protein CAEBREN_02450 [Caenorhabditis brenneri]|uniref:Uncharacterized protein n=1 Tax=Caenorhabditis brenneri TaxID=135651 RepID=G0MM66_CAEBE|nr:hypothetical protein CAEBREN_02450 [Caenorhabditis brenneri]
MTRIKQVARKSTGIGPPYTAKQKRWWNKNRKAEKAMVIAVRYSAWGRECRVVRRAEEAEKREAEKAAEEAEKAAEEAEKAAEEAEKAAKEAKKAAMEAKKAAEEAKKAAEEAKKGDFRRV